MQLSYSKRKLDKPNVQRETLSNGHNYTDQWCEQISLADLALCASPE